MEGAAHPAWKEGRRSKGGVPGPRSLTPSSSSYRGVSSLLQNPTGEGPGPLSGLHPLRKAPFVPNTRGPGRGTEAWAWTDLQTCPEDRWSVCARARVCRGGQGAEVVQCTTRTCLPSLINTRGGHTGAGLPWRLGMILSSNLSPGPLPPSKSDTQAEALPDQRAVLLPVPQREKPGGQDPVPLTPGMSEHLPETAGKGDSCCRGTGDARGLESREVGQAETDTREQI